MLYIEDPTPAVDSTKSVTNKNRKEYKQKLLLEKAAVEVAASGENQICIK